MKKILFGLMAVLSMVFLVACGDKKEAANDEQKLVRYNLDQNPPQMDPQLSTDITSGTVLGHTFEGLTILGKGGKVLPGVAESWTNEGNTWTFKLRKDAKWQNGEMARQFEQGFSFVKNERVSWVGDAQVGKRRDRFSLSISFLEARPKRIRQPVDHLAHFSGLKPVRLGHITQRRARAEAVDGRHHCHPVRAVCLENVLDDSVSAVGAQVGINIRGRGAGWVQKTLKIQVQP